MIQLLILEIQFLTFIGNIYNSLILKLEDYLLELLSNLFLTLLLKTYLLELFSNR